MLRMFIFKFLDVVSVDSIDAFFDNLENVNDVGLLFMSDFGIKTFIEN